MGETEKARDDDKREPRECPNRDRCEFLIDEVAKEKSAPENFLDQRHNHHEAQKAHPHRRPIEWRPFAEQLGIESDCARSEAEKLLRRYPDREDNQSDCNGKPNLTRGPKFVVAPEP